MDREAWRAAVHGVARVRQEWATELKELTLYFYWVVLIWSQPSWEWSEAHLNSYCAYLPIMLGTNILVRRRMSPEKYLQQELSSGASLRKRFNKCHQMTHISWRSIFLLQKNPLSRLSSLTGFPVIFEMASFLMSLPLRIDSLSDPLKHTHTHTHTHAHTHAHAHTYIIFILEM